MLVAIYVTLKLASPRLHPLNEFFLVFFTKVAILRRTVNLSIGLFRPALRAEGGHHRFRAAGLGTGRLVDIAAGIENPADRDILASMNY